MEAILKWLETTLASLLDALKAKNPLLYGIIAIILGAIMYVLEKGLASGIIQSTDIINTIKGIVFVLATLLGSRTFNFLPASKKAKVTE